MSGSLRPTVAAAPTTTQTATNLLAMMAALNGRATDFNQGSQIRTLAEAIGSVVDMQGVGGQALAVQALVYGAMSLFKIPQPHVTPAVGVVTFATSIPILGAPNVAQAVPIPSGTLVQTNGGVQFATTAAAVLASGTNSVNVGIVALNAGGANAGTDGNVPAGAITGTPLTPIGYPFFVTNGAPTAGGTNAGNQSTALAAFTARANSLGLASPVAIANSAIGVQASGTGETVLFENVFEPWIAAGSGAGSGTAGFTLYIDNGTGTSSPDLVAAAQAWITGSNALNQSGYRPAGVPFIVSGASPVYASVGVTGVLTPGLLGSGSVYGAIVSGITGYFNSLPIAPVSGGADIAYQPQVAAQAADAGLSAFQALTVNLYYFGSGIPVSQVSGGVGTRVILSNLSVALSVGN